MVKSRLIWLRRSLTAGWLCLAVSLMTGLPASAATVLAESEEGNSSWGALALLALGPIVYGVIYARYRNPSARHKYESETDVKIDHLAQVDQFVEQRKKTRDSKLPGANSTQLRGNPLAGQIGSGRVQGWVNQAANKKKG
ncbi:MAG: hypothetical protein FWG16_03280 [Micrococcales bacterium]|nr:hypothetical protein [Micrococcales bacterium]